MARVALREIHKRFGATQALRGASLEVEAGEVHALLGENGAGKTTLVRTLYGNLQPDSGELQVDGKRVEIPSPKHALELGIGLVHQHFMLVPALTVAENLALGETGSWRLSPAALHASARRVLDRFELDVEPDAITGDLPVAQKQRLEIARALVRGARVLVLDEPTAVLAPSEVAGLLRLIGNLRDEGCSVILISHKLEEITAVCDRVTVLRAGETVATREVAGLTADELGRWMVGDALPPPGRPPETEPGPPALRLTGLCSEGLAGIDLEVRAGEILALAGIDGNGQGPLEEVLAGVRRIDAGELQVLRTPLAMVSGDRQHTGLVLDLSLRENLILLDATAGGGEPVFRRGLMSMQALDETARAAIEAFEIQAEPGSRVDALSGGNQQKLCIARALREPPGVFVAVNPTRGLDVAATGFVRELIRDQARRGCAVLLISTDLDEVLELGQRVAVLYRGRALPIASDQREREQIGQVMLGVQS